VVFVADRSEERERRLVGFQLADAARALREMFFECLVDVARQMMLDVVGEKAHEVGAARFRVSHGTLEVSRSSNIRRTTLGSAIHQTPML